LNDSVVRFYGEKHEAEMSGVQCPICSRHWLVASPAVFNHLVTEHSDDERFVSASVEFAKTCAAAPRKRSRCGGKQRHITSVMGKIAESLLAATELDKEQVKAIIKGGQKEPKKRYSDKKTADQKGDEDDAKEDGDWEEEEVGNEENEAWEGDEGDEGDSKETGYV
jgi:hypothetical protein